jgi:glutamyl/glutaminyl-tRNA synthetase
LSISEVVDMVERSKAARSAALQKYRGRLAPSPTGYLHLGHARTFWIAQERARAAGGKLVLRIEDLDRARCRAEFVEACLEDMAWFGFQRDEGPIFQSERLELYRAAFEKLRAGGFLFPCVCSRADVLRALQAPHAGEDEPIYPGTCRERNFSEEELRGRQVNWRFRVPDNRNVRFHDGRMLKQSFVAGRDFGDFVVWRHDDLPSYQLSVVVDDSAMGITEVVRGEDLLRSTARQILLYDALKVKVPAFYHCPLMLDEKGERLAKRHDSLSLRKLRAQGRTPESMCAEWVAL